MGKVKGVEFTKSPLPDEARLLLAEGSGYALIASSEEDEASLPGKPYSVFTCALIEALCGHGKSLAFKDGYVRVGDLAMHTSQRVVQLTNDKQHPILHWNEGDNFRIAYYAAGDVQPKGLPFQVELEPISELKTNVVFDQPEQQIESQTNVAEVRGHFVKQDNWTVRGDVVQPDGDVIITNKNRKKM